MTTLNARFPVLAGLAAATLAAQPSPQFLRDDVLSVLEWREIGPTNMGGRIVDVAVNPHNPAEFFVASATGGLFRTSNNGTTFRAVFDGQSHSGLGAVAVAASKPEVVYVGTGEANQLRSVYWGNGVWRSDDGGDKWRHIGLDGTDHIARIAVHPTDPDTLWVAAMGPLYSPGEQRGVFRSGDGGKTWQRTLYVGDGTGCCDIAIDPADPDVLYAAMYECRRRAWHFTEGGESGGIWKSDDGGREWKKLRGGLPDGTLGRIGLAVFPADPRVLYAYVENRNAAADTDTVDTTEPDADDGPPRSPDYDDPAWDAAAARAEGLGEAAPSAVAAAAPRRIHGGQIWRSDDAGGKWTLVKDGLISRNPDHYFYFFGQVRVHPQDKNRLWVLDVRVHTSKDGGKNWRSDFGRGLHGDHHALWIDARNPERMLLGNDGGLAQTWDSGASWEQFDHLPLAQYYAIAVDNRRPYTIYGGLQDNGSWGIPAYAPDSGGLRPRLAFRIGGGDGFCAAVDPGDPDTIYSESQFGALYRFDRRTGERANIKPRARRGEPRLRSNWMSPVVVSPHNPHTVLFGTQMLHRSRNRGDTWEVISPDLTTADRDKIAGNVPHCTITTIAESPARAGVLWVGTDDGKVWTSRTDGGRWTDLSDRFPGLPAGLWVSRVEPSHFDDDVAFVAFTGYREDIRTPFLYLTEDGGETFRSIANDLPQESINVVRQHPRSADVLFVGTDFRVHVSLDGGSSWHPLQNDMPTNPVHDLIVHPAEDDLIAATHGRGLFVMDIAPLAALDRATLGQPLALVGVRDGWLPPRGADSGTRGVRAFHPEDADGRPVFWVYLGEDRDEAAELVVRDAAGRTLFRRQGLRDAGLHRVAWRPSTRSLRRGGGRAGGGGRGPGGGDNFTAGHFAVELTAGDQRLTRSVRVAQAARSPLALPVPEPRD